ncbi:hypothetical protein [Enterobacter sp.]|uniref:hypothetical protein n=1 Tax=Enterobacter sp. TaxID=42895 RepID=UPI00296F98D5|nr:hypothetical protein [Enterobacter sp.]
MSDYDEEYDEDYDEGERDEEDDDDLEYNDYAHVPHGQICERCRKRPATIARDDDYYCNDCA